MKIEKTLGNIMMLQKPEEDINHEYNCRVIYLLIFLFMQVFIVSLFLYRGMVMADIIWALPITTIAGACGLFVLPEYSYYLKKRFR